MAICERHGVYLKGQEICGYCFREGFKEKSIKKKSAPGKKTSKKVLKDKAQALFSQLVKLTYCKDQAFTNCYTCDKRIQVKGSDLISTTHAGHYFPKSTHWMIAYDIENAAPQCYQCNVWNQGIIPAMRSKLVEKWGEEKIKDLEQRAEEFTIKVKTGQLKSQPDDIWLMAKIQELKSKLK